MSQFWNHKLVSTVLALTLFSFSSWAQNVEQVKDARTYLPDLSSKADVETLKAYIATVLPEAFNKGRFTIGVEENIAQEQKFLKSMNTPEMKALYNREMPKRNPYQAIDIMTYIADYEITQNIESIVQKDLAEKFLVLAEQYPDKESRVQKMSELVFNLNSQSSNGLLIGMVQSLPNEIKGQAFKLDYASKLEFLKNNLTNENFKANFKSTYYNVDQITVEQMLNEVQRLVTVESQIAEFSLFTYWKNKNYKTNELYRVQEIDLFKDLDYLSQFKLEAPELNKVKEAIKNTTQNFIKSHSSPNVRTPVSKPKDKITIREVSPFLGQYRGEINNNCSTALAFGFAYSPAERTYVLEVNGKVLFTISATEVRMKKQKTLYLYEMGQLNVSADLAEYVMRAFYEVRNELGFENIAGSYKRMHYSNFGEKMLASSENKKIIDVKHIDGKTREAIGELMVKIAGPVTQKFKLWPEYAKAHDLPSQHSTGFIFTPKNDYSVVITSQVRTQKPEKLPASLNLGLVAFAPQENRLLEKAPAAPKPSKPQIMKCEMLFH